MSSREPDSDGARRSRALRRFGDKHYNRGKRRLSTALAAAQRIYNSTRWKALRAAVLNEFPLCAECASRGLVVAAVDVDHREPLALRLDLAYEWANLQPLCRRCHNAKTAGEKAQAERSIMHGDPLPRDPEAPPAQGTLSVGEGTRVVLTFPPGTPPALVARVRANLAAWADRASQHLGFLPTVIVRTKVDDAPSPPA